MTKTIPVVAQAAELLRELPVPQAREHALGIAKFWNRSAEISRPGKPRDTATARAIYWRQVAEAVVS